ncbi:MAG: hypothetical protein SGJ11_08705 [Phycisphaerae bacterium]|nr:hypothetical protein [Phycisphaerae bacterium]
MLPPILQTGNNWAFAYKDLQNALVDAAPGDEIWVAGGTYKPTSTTSRTVSFTLESGVQLLGGFVGNETLAGQRDPAANFTVLSGNIGAPSASDNSFHVVVASNCDNTCRIDGFTITGGNADTIGGFHNFGGGLFMDSGSPIIRRCRFVANNAVIGGGVGRVGPVPGNEQCNLANCLFVGNTAGGGGAIHSQASPISIHNSTIAHNTSQNALQLVNTPAVSSIVSVIIFANTGGPTPESSQFDLVGSSLLIVSKCCIEGWDNSAPNGVNTISDPPLFAAPASADGVIGTLDDHFVLRGDSPCIDHGACGASDLTDMDGDGSFGELIPVDLDGAQRIQDDPLHVNSSGGQNPTADIGAHEYTRGRLILVNHAATGSNNGTSWTNAYTDLQSAVQELNDPKFGGEGEIWVAQGTYKPTTGSSQAVSFELGSDITMLGGFAGGELSRSARDPRLNVTILSGELGAPGPVGNSQHVLLFQGEFNDNSTVDGFTIRDGAATVAEGGGGAVIGNGASPVISNCVITNNTGSGNGSAVLISGPATSATIANCIITGSTAIASGTPGLHISGAPATIDNCTVAGNSTASAGVSAGITTSSGVSSALVQNTLVFGNTAGAFSILPAQFRNNSQPVTVTHCAIQGFTQGSLPGATVVNTFAAANDGGVADANGPDDTFGTADDNFTPSACSELVDAGSSTNVPLDNKDLDDDGNLVEILPFDINGDPRRVDLAAPNVLAGTIGAIDIGAVERQLQPLADADFDNDGHVAGAGLALLLGAWSTFGAEFDLNVDCLVDASDLAILLGAWTG